MNYTIREISQRTGIPASTLRFYETRGLLPRVKRDPHGVRVYDDADLDRLGTITCLKNTGMGVGEMARFMALYEQGDATLAERRELVRAQQPDGVLLAPVPELLPVQPVGKPLEP